MVAQCGVLMLLLNACGFQPAQATPSSIPSTLTPTIKVTQVLRATNIPVATEKATTTPTETQGCTDTKGKLIAGEFESQLLKKPFNFQLYLPACFNTDLELRYPVAYLMHGLYTDETQWNLIGLADAMDTFIDQFGKPFIVVMPRIPDTDTQKNSPIMEVITDELVTYVDKNYPTLIDRQYRAIGGISRGASLALRIGYDRRDLFGKIGMHSLPMLVDESTYYAKALGKLDNDERPLLFLDSGNDDRDLAVARTFDIELTKLAVPHTWYMFNGYHDEVYWSEHLPIYLEWYGQGW